MNNTPIMQKSNIDIEKLRAVIFLKYGYNLDDTSLVILYILTDQQNATFSNQNKKIDGATEKINDSQRSLQVDKDHPGWQAFCFGFGKLGIAFIIAITAAIIMSDLYLEDKKENRPEIMEWYKNYYLNTKGLSKKQAADYVKKNPVPANE